MKRAMNKMLTVLFVFAFLTPVFAMAPRVEALEPVLLWEKEFDYEIHCLDLARETGEVIVSLRNEVLLLDKNGNENFHWGPRVDRVALGCSLASKGNLLTLDTSYSEQYADQMNVKGWSGDKFHLYDARTNKELWNKRGTEELSLLSPSGNRVVSFHYQAGYFQIFDIHGNELNSVEISLESITFSPDGKYFITNDETLLALFDNYGVKQWEKAGQEILSISESAKYISTSPWYMHLNSDDSEFPGALYDNEGNKVMDGLGVLSADGSRIAVLSRGIFSILSLPDKTLMAEITLNTPYKAKSDDFTAQFSYSGRYFVYRDGNELFVYDVSQKSKTKIDAPEVGNRSNIFLSNNGAYLLYAPHGPGLDKTIYYYQLH